MIIFSAIQRLERALECNREILERVQPIIKTGDKKDDGERERDTFSSDMLPDELQADSAR